MVLPKPWQRLQAPYGLLKLNRLGSGVDEFLAAALAGEFLVEAQRIRRPPAGSKITSPASR